MYRIFIIALMLFSFVMTADQAFARQIKMGIEGETSFKSCMNNPYARKSHGTGSSFNTVSCCIGGRCITCDTFHGAGSPIILGSCTVGTQPPLGGIPIPHQSMSSSNGTIPTSPGNAGVAPTAPPKLSAPQTLGNRVQTQSNSGRATVNTKPVRIIERSKPGRPRPGPTTGPTVPPRPTGPFKPSHGGTAVGAIPLTKGECKKLGGKVMHMKGCPGSGRKACTTSDVHGRTHIVCLKHASLKKVKGSKMAKPGPRSGFQLPVAGGSIMTAPLTRQECKGLGGEVSSTNKCSAAGHRACRTIDRHGVVRVACINKKARN